jgi:hypothetical protein
MERGDSKGRSLKPIPFNSHTPRFVQNRNTFTTPGPCDYDAIDQKFRDPKDIASTAFKSEERLKHSLFTNIERATNKIVGPANYSKHSGMLKKTFNATLPPKKFI